MRVLKEDIAFVRIALLNNIISEQQLEKAREIQRSSASNRPLSMIILDNGFVTKEQFRKILDAQKRKLPRPAINLQEKKDDIFFAYVANKHELIPLDDLKASFRDQADLAKRSLLFRISEVLLNTSRTSLATIDEVNTLQCKYIVSCPNCKAKYNVIHLEVTNSFTCRRCENEINVPSELIQMEYLQDFIIFRDQITLSFSEE